MLAHYFTDRADILASALVAAHRGVRARIEESVGVGTLGVSKRFGGSCSKCCHSAIKVILEARIEACFWGEAIGNHDLMKIQNDEVGQFLWSCPCLTGASGGR